MDGHRDSMIESAQWADSMKSFIKQASAGLVAIETFTPSFPVILRQPDQR